MTTMEQEPGRSLSYIEGRLEEQSKAIELLHSDLKGGLAELSRRLDAGLQEVRAGQRQILITAWIIGGGLIAGFIGAMVTMIALVIGGG